MYPVAGGVQGYAGLLIPEIWSPLFVEEFYEASVLDAIANTDYEGEITAYGDKVNIRYRAQIEIHDYDAGQDLEIQQPEQDMTALLIDRGHYFNLLIKDIDRAQSDVEFLEEWTQDGAERMTERVNEVVLSEVYADVAAENKGATAGRKSQSFDLGEVGSPLGISKSNVIEVLGRVAAVLTEAKVPQRDRWMVIPAWVEQMIYASPERQALVQGSNEDLLRNYYIGRLANFDIYGSNQLADVTDGSDNVTNIIAGHKSALTFANQLVESEVIRAQTRFGNFARALDVYGFNVNKGDAMCHVYATPA